MKYVLFLLMSCFGVSAQALPMVSLNPSSTILGFNEAFTVDVLVSGIESTNQLIAFGFDVGTDFGLTFNGATIVSPFLDDSGFFASTDVAGSTFPSIFGDDILLSTLSLVTGTTSGLLNLTVFTTPLDLGVSDALFTIDTTYDISKTAVIEVNRTSTVPLPSTLLLLGLGLLSLAPRLRRP